MTKLDWGRGGEDRDQQADGSEFVVRLDGIKLPADIEQRLEQEIRRLVMSELAGLDLARSMVAPVIDRTARSRIGGIGSGGGHGTMGYFLKVQDLEALRKS